MEKSGCYLIHFDSEVPNVKKQYGDSRHYFGKSINIARRVNNHFTGCGSVVTRKAFKLGIGMKLALSWPGNDKKEHELVNSNLMKVCPICKESNNNEVDH